MANTNEDINEAARKILKEDEFKKRIEELVTEAVAQAVNRVNEAAETRIAELELELSETRTRLLEAEQRLEDFDTQNRRTSLVITGVPETAGEATDSLVLDVGRAAGVNLSADSVDRSHRLGRPQSGKTRPIVVKFTTLSARQKIFEKRKELTTDRVKDHPVLTRSVVNRTYISENLTSKNQHLLFVARQLKKRKTLWAAYTTNGYVRVKMTEDGAAKTITQLADFEDIVGPDALREFRPRGNGAARPARRGTDLTWRTTDALNAWVNERRSGRPATDRSGGSGRDERRQ